MPNNFKYRSDEKEILDEPDVPQNLLALNLRELDWLNSYLGGYSHTLKGIKKLVYHREKPWHIVDLGCGGGDTLKHICLWAKKNRIKVRLTGVDNNPFVIEYLNKNCRGFTEIRGVVSDYREYLEKEKDIDIIHCSLFCHHLNDQAMENLFLLIKKKASAGFVINDLQRSRLAYCSVWILTRVLNASRLAKHDGPVSVKRAFTKKELQNMLKKIHFSYYSIRWKWAFRYLITGKI